MIELPEYIRDAVDGLLLLRTAPIGFSDSIESIQLPHVAAITPTRVPGGFMRDGSVHYEGIQNEKSVVEWLNHSTSLIGQHLRADNPTAAFEHRGGTKTKVDAVMVNRETGTTVSTISIKNHKTGTFDWANLSSGYSDEMKSILTQRTKQIKTANQSVEESRIACNAMFSDVLSEIKTNSNWIKSLIQSIHAKNCDYIIVNDEKYNRLVWFPNTALTELVAVDTDTYSLKHSPGKCSAQIMRRSDGSDKDINTGLRIRLVLNNGVTALMGKSGANKSSSPCVKIQQDNIKKLLDAVAPHSIVESYSVPHKYNLRSQEQSIHI